LFADCNLYILIEIETQLTQSGSTYPFFQVH
jgi:hypothetical protein